MNYILLLYLLSISIGTLNLSNTSKEREVPVSNTPGRAIYNKIPDQRYQASYNFIDPAKDSIGNVIGLSAFYQKLLALKAGQINRVNIVQIGDSHIQPDLISREVRIGLQDFFGDAGRGLVFPYQVARTNGPFDISSSASTRWLHNKLSQVRTASANGIAGFSLTNGNGLGSLRLLLKPDMNARRQSFDYIKLFVGKGTWDISSIGTNTHYTVRQTATTNFDTKEIILRDAATGFNLKSLASKPSFFGASLEKRNSSGVLFHTIGVNGASYDQYNKEPLFWEQLPELNADLYILSMGTNEAFYTGMTEELYIDQVSETIAKIQAINANASILITTTAESFKNGRTNPMIERLNLALKFYCNKMGIPIWDLFEVTGGSGSSSDWLQNNLLQADKIHYQQKAYSMQGALLFDALATGYNEFVGPQPSLSLPLDTRTASK